MNATQKEERKMFRDQSIKDKMVHKQNENQTYLEELESLNKITVILLKNHDVYDWSIDDVVTWLQAIQLDAYVELFKANHINGYTLINLTDKDLESLKITDILKRKNLLK
mmetsp:Transcript_12184/g.12019  ORF Transcript_12184/g.12019 Transcript_12184/m.12019 type:complete len:110 (+) Transcript_12184:541-870(+)